MMKNNKEINEKEIETQKQEEKKEKYEKIINKKKGGKNETNDDEEEGNAKVLGILFIIALTGLIYTFYTFPSLEGNDADKLLKIPRTVDDLKNISIIMGKYREHHFWSVYSAFIILYLFLQTFAIPGAIFLSILAGPLFGVGLGLFTVTFSATSGASMCFLMSHYLGRGLVQKYFGGPLEKFRKKIKAHRHNLFFYLLFLRVSPLLPNWFISVACPILGVPLSYFASATFIGLIPANYIHVTTGLALGEMQSLSEFNPKKLLTLLGLACLALIPTLFRKKFEELDKIDGDKEKKE